MPRPITNDSESLKGDATAFASEVDHAGSVAYALSVAASIQTGGVISLGAVSLAPEHQSDDEPFDGALSYGGDTLAGESLSALGEVNDGNRCVEFNAAWPLHMRDLNRIKVRLKHPLLCQEAKDKLREEKREMVINFSKQYPSCFKYFSTTDDSHSGRRRLPELCHLSTPPAREVGPGDAACVTIPDDCHDCLPLPTGKMIVLWKVVHSPADELVKWSDDGMELLFDVTNQARFDKEVLHQHFPKMNMFDSLVDFLQRCDFGRIKFSYMSCIDDQSTVKHMYKFRHPNFRRGCLEKLHLIRYNKRKAAEAKRRAAVARTSPAPAPLSCNTFTPLKCTAKPPKPMPALSCVAVSLTCKGTQMTCKGTRMKCTPKQQSSPVRATPATLECLPKPKRRSQEQSLDTAALECLPKPKRQRRIEEQEQESPFESPFFLVCQWSPRVNRLLKLTDEYAMTRGPFDFEKPGHLQTLEELLEQQDLLIAASAARMVA